MTCGSVAVYFSGLRAGKRGTWRRHPSLPSVLLFCTLQISPLSSSGGDTSLGGREGEREGPAFLAPRDGKGGGRPPPELLRRGGAKRGGAEAGDRMLLVYRKLRDMGK